MADDSTDPQPPGPAVDQAGNPVVDPTKNVLNLVDAAIQRQDDLARERERRQDDLRRQEAQNLRELIALRAEHLQQMRNAEAERINAIRAVDVAAVQQAAQVSATQANTLATQVATSAETLRNQVAAAATASTVSLAAALEPIIRDIADLRRAQYEAQGQKTQVIERQAGTANTGVVIAAAVALVGVFIAVAGIVTAIVLSRS